MTYDEITGIILECALLGAEEVAVVRVGDCVSGVVVFYSDNTVDYVDRDGLHESYFGERRTYRCIQCGTTHQSSCRRYDHLTPGQVIDHIRSPL